MADIDNKEQSELDRDLDDAEEVEEEETGEATKIKARQLTVQMMQNPQILAALQERLDGLVDTPTGYIESLPRVLKRRVNALKNLQVNCAQIEAKFYEEVHDLERKYAVLYQPLFDKRFEIINAIYEPTEEEFPESGDLDDDAEAILAADFEIDRFLRERIIPRSVLYFTGEAIEDDDDGYDEEGEEADEEGEEEDQENDPDYDPKKKQNPAECKRQQSRMVYLLLSWKG
ncbi:Nucleosome assembly protein 1-like 1 [Heterocephalus glaber]|uniref:Nucleosome assembly protein 1-like 1 n=1 Tax=Heterocephalus glaber TaxID=10181 RepID=G5BFQ3_HETGA|nr:Nucleosome assembly protein 1-like 1 [Heterocephalus glaber]